jgi:hypothetical protein
MSKNLFTAVVSSLVSCLLFFSVGRFHQGLVTVAVENKVNSFVLFHDPFAINEDSFHLE